MYKGTLNNYGAKMERQDREKQKFQKMLAGGVFYDKVIMKKYYEEDLIMKTQVSILVRNASLYARAKTLFWFVNIFKKLPVNVWIDEDPETAKNPTMVLKASEKPYEIDLAPGHHVLYFSDPKAGEKRFTNAVTGAFLGGALLGAGGGSVLAGGAIGADLANENSVGVGYASFVLKEGDVFKLSVRPNRNGKINVKQL